MSHIFVQGHAGMYGRSASKLQIISVVAIRCVAAMVSVNMTAVRFSLGVVVQEVVENEMQQGV